MQRFSRVRTHHGLHAVLTVLTLGIWGISWLAMAVGNRIWPWRCRSCHGNEPDLRRTDRSAAPGTEASPRQGEDAAPPQPSPANVLEI